MLLSTFSDLDRLVQNIDNVDLAKCVFGEKCDVYATQIKNIWKILCSNDTERRIILRIFVLCAKGVSREGNYELRNILLNAMGKRDNFNILIGKNPIDNSLTLKIKSYVTEKKTVPSSKETQIVPGVDLTDLDAKKITQFNVFCKVYDKYISAGKVLTDEEITEYNAKMQLHRYKLTQLIRLDPRNDLTTVDSCQAFKARLEQLSDATMPLEAEPIVSFIGSMLEMLDMIIARKPKEELLKSLELLSKRTIPTGSYHLEGSYPIIGILIRSRNLQLLEILHVCALCLRRMIEPDKV
jgi:hypothetical protein